MKYNTYFLLALLSLSVVACNQDAEILEESSARTEIQVFGDINDMTRAVNKTKWAKKDKIGLFLPANNNLNIPYQTLAADGKFTPAGDSKVYLLTSEGETSVSAYYPYRADIGSDGLYTVSSWKGQDASHDLLWAEAKCSPLNPEAQFSFHHHFTKISFTLGIVEDQFSNLSATDLPTVQIQAENLNYPITVDLLTGAIAYTGTSGEAIPIENKDNSGELIFAPEANGHNHTERQIRFYIPGKDLTFYWKIDDSEVFEQGKAYSYKLKLNSIKQTVEVEQVTGTIVPWDKGNGNGEEVILTL